MNTKTCKELALLAAMLQKAKPEEYPAVCAQAAIDFSKAARILHRIAENRCNRELTERECRQESRTIDKLTKWCDSWGLCPDIHGDPRGFVLYLKGFKDSQGRPAYNSWGGAEDGWGVAC